MSVSDTLDPHLFLHCFKCHQVIHMSFLKIFFEWISESKHHQNMMPIFFNSTLL